MPDTIAKLNSIIEASQKLTATIDLDELLNIILDIAIDELSCGRGTVYLIDKEKKEIFSKVFRGGEIREIREPLGKGISGTVAKTGETLIVDDAYLDPRFDRKYDLITGFATHSVLCLPLKKGNEIVGVLQLLDSETGKFTKKDADYLSALASHMAIAIENARLVHEQKRLLESRDDLVTKLESAYHEVIYRLARAAEHRDSDTGTHIERMAEYCQVLATKCGLGEKECRLIRYAAQMHDIGKIGIPDRILQKNGPLTDEEYEIMKLHTTIGAEILSHSDSEILRMAYEICLAHHEKWDGSGYPHGLKGYQISIVGRIAALADALDALTMKRVYKEAVSFEEALAIIKSDRGAHFDPYIVTLTEESIEEIKAVKRRIDGEM